MIRPEIGLSDSFLDLSVETGTTLDGSFIIYSKNGQELKGDVLSTNYKLTPNEKQISGKECRISYTFHGEMEEPGEEYYGEFLLLTNGGEYNIPFCVSVTPKKFRYGNQTLCSLEEFYEFAKKDWKQAKDMFFTKDFPEIMLADQEEYKSLYHDLLKGFSKDTILEQFFIETMKKEPVKVFADKETLPIDGSKVGKLILKKEGWGCLEGRMLGAEGNLYINYERITQADFVEETLEIFLSLKEGAQKDVLVIETAFSRLSIPVYKEIKKSEEEAVLVKENRDFAKLIRHLVDFRTGKTEAEEFVSRSMQHLPVKGLFYELYCLLLLIIHADVTGTGKDECDEYAKKIKEKAAEYLEDTECSSFYHYVMALWKKDNGYAKAAAHEVRKNYEKEKSLRNYLILLTLDESLAFQFESQWEELVPFLEQGENSPMLYLAVLDILNQEPYLLEQLHEQKVPVIRWGLRHQYLSRKLLEQFARLAIREKNFKRNQLPILQIVYEKKPDDLYLKAICSMLMKGNRKEKEYHPYFEDAVKRHLNLVGLNEFYLRSLDFDTYPVLPKLILYYFHYSNSLDKREKAWLYLNILQNKEVYEDIYDNYAERIEEFVKEQLVEGRMNRYLKKLYDILLPSLLSEVELAKYVPNIIFKKRLVCHNPMMEGVYVSHPENDEEVHISFVDGLCQIESYSPHTKIYFADRMGNRYRSGISYTLESYLNEELYRGFCLEHVKDDRRVYVKWVMGPELATAEQPDRLSTEEEELDGWKYEEEKKDILLEQAHRHLMYRNYNKEMVLYLRKHFKGRVFDLLDLWDVLEKEAMLTPEYEKQVLDQIAFVGSKDERMLQVLYSYLEKEEDEELAETMLENYSMSYVLYGLEKRKEPDMELPELFFTILDRQAQKRRLRNLWNRLAFLYHKAVEGYEEKDQMIIRTMIREFCQQEIIFPFFRQFERLISIPSLWKESLFLWFTGKEKMKYIVTCVSDFEEDCRKRKILTREIAPGFYYGSLYLPAFEFLLQINAPEYDGRISMERMYDYLPGSRNHLLLKMKEEKATAGSWISDYEKIMTRMKEQLKFLSDR